MLRKTVKLTQNKLRFRRVESIINVHFVSRPKISDCTKPSATTYLFFRLGEDVRSTVFSIISLSNDLYLVISLWSVHRSTDSRSCPLASFSEYSKHATPQSKLVSWCCAVIALIDAAGQSFGIGNAEVASFSLTLFA